MVIRIVPSRISSMVGNWVVLDSYTPPARSRPLYPSPTVEWSIDTLPLTALFETASSKQDITHRICSDRHGRHVCPDRRLLSLIGVLLGLTLLFISPAENLRRKEADFQSHLLGSDFQANKPVYVQAPCTNVCSSPTDLLQVRIVGTELAKGALKFHQNPTTIATKTNFPVETASLSGLSKAAREQINALVTLYVATDGNRGRAVAFMAKVLPIPVEIYVPRFLDEAALARISGEGAKPAMAITPVGVGSLAQAAVSHYKALADQISVVAVEPDTAACLHKSLKSSICIPLKTSSSTILKGLDCRTYVSSTAWPILQAGVGMTISDFEAHNADKYLESQNIVTKGTVRCSTTGCPDVFIPISTPDPDTVVRPFLY
ncbi:hypothetical protein PABG_06934 [Paracoccidioides brasiliensis Pb03]|nr:hypothetical protein PABG_06934 [Paracoccidioides brasiliensis Pb03]